MSYQNYGHPDPEVRRLKQALADLHYGRAQLLDQLREERRRTWKVVLGAIVGGFLFVGLLWAVGL